MSRSKSSSKMTLGAWKVASTNHFCRVSLITERELSAIWPQDVWTVSEISGLGDEEVTDEVTG